MSARPQAETVHLAFVFTDIEGSTRLLEHLGAGYAEVLGDHAQIVRDGITRHRGREVDTQGDAFFAVFPDAGDAVRMTSAIQQRLAEHPWPEGVTVRLRMGVHVGHAIATRTGFVGMDVHHGARVAAAAHGGQVLVSGDVKRELADVTGAVGDEPEPIPPLRSLGEFALKDIREPVELLQVEVPGLPGEFPPPRTLDDVDEPPTAGDPPYPGLVPFEEADADRFFGRQTLIRSLVERLEHDPFLAVIGASGSGKSSLVRAGLVPALRASEPDVASAAVPPDARARTVALLTPTDQPLNALAEALAGIEGQPWAIVVDQLEELFTLSRDELERTTFIDRILGLFDAGARVIVVMRADLYDRLAPHERLRTLVSEHQSYLGPLGPAELRAAIEGPAKQGSWRIAPGLTDLIIHDVGQEPGALPLLSHALRETWERRRGTLLNLRGYLDSGGVQGAIARTADTLTAEMTEDDLARTRRILLRLTELGQDAPDTRRRATFDELLRDGDEDRDRMRAVLDRLVAARLVVTDDHTAEVAHEALIREWPQLREWLDEDRQSLRLHRAITEAAIDWDRIGRDPSLLFRGARLAAATEWLAGHRRDPNELERSFIDASRVAATAEAEEREAARQRELEAAQRVATAERDRADVQARSARRIRRAAGALVCLLIVAIVAAGLAFVQTQQADRSAQEAKDQSVVAEQRRQEAEDQSRIALGRQLVAQSATAREEPDRSLLLALEGVDRDPSGEAIQNLATALAQADEAMTYRFPTDGAGALAASPDGSLVAVVARTDEEDLLRVHRTDDWSLVEGPIPASVNHSLLTGAGPYGENTAFDSSGKRLVFPTPDALGIMDLATGEVTVVPGTENALVDSLAWRTSDDRLAWISRDDFLGDPVVRILGTDGTTVESFPLTPTFQVAEDAAPYPGFLSPGGRWIVTSDGTHAQLFDADTGAALGVFPDGETSVAGFGADGGSVAMRGPDGVVVRTLPDLAQVGSTVSLPSLPFLVEPEIENDLLRVWADGRSMATYSLVWGGLVTEGDPVAGSIVKVAFSDVLRFVARMRTQDTAIEVVDPKRASRLETGERSSIYPEGTTEEDNFRRAISDDGSAVSLMPWTSEAPSRSALVSDTDGEGEQVEVRPDEPSGIAAAALTPDGRALVTFHDSGRLIRTDWASGVAEDLGVHESPDPVMGALVVGPEGLAAQMGDERIRLFGADGDRYLAVPGVNGQFLPDGSALLVTDCDGGTVHRIDLVTDAVTDWYVGGCPWDLDASPDGSRLLVTDEGSDGVIREIALADGSLVGGIVLPSTPVAIRYEDATDGATVIGVRDGSLLRYHADSAVLQTIACATAGRNLTSEEWSQALPGLAYHATCPGYPGAETATGPDASATPSDASPGPSSGPDPSTPPETSGLCVFSNLICWQPPGRVVLPAEPRLSVGFDGSWYMSSPDGDHLEDAYTFVHDEGRVVTLILGPRDLIGADGAPVTLEPAPEAFVEGLRADPRLTVGETTATTLFGQPALSVDMTVNEDTELITYPESGVTFFVPAGWKERFIATVVDEELVLVAVEAPEAELDRFWESDAEALLDSMQLEPAVG